MDAFGEGWVNNVGPTIGSSWSNRCNKGCAFHQQQCWGIFLVVSRMHLVGSKKNCAHVEASSTINIHSPTKFSMSLIVG